MEEGFQDAEKLLFMARGIPRFVHWSTGWCRGRSRRTRILLIRCSGGVRFRAFFIFPNKLLPKAIAVIVNIDGQDGCRSDPDGQILW